MHTLILFNPFDSHFYCDVAYYTHSVSGSSQSVCIIAEFMNSVALAGNCSSKPQQKNNNNNNFESAIYTYFCRNINK